MSIVVNPLTGGTFPLTSAGGLTTRRAPIGQLVQCHTAGGGVVVQAPSAPSAGTVFAVADVDDMAATNAITVDGDGALIDGAPTLAITQSGATAVFLFDAGQWRQLVDQRIVDSSPRELEYVADLNAATPASVAAAIVTAENFATAADLVVSASSAADATSKANAAQAAAIGTAAADATSKANAAQAAAIAASQPLDSDLTAIAALTTQPFGRSLLTQATAPAAQLALGTGWITAVDLNLAAEPTQSLAANGTYTIGGVAGIKRENAAGDRVAMAITNGQGLVIKAGASVYDGTTRSAPLLWIPLSSLGVASLDWDTRWRVSAKLTDGFAAGGIFNAGDLFFFGLDSDSTSWMNWVNTSPQSGTTRRWFAACAAAAGLKVSSTFDEAGTLASNPANVMIASFAGIASPDFGKAIFAWDKTSAAWPAYGAASVRPRVMTSSTGTMSASLNLVNQSLTGPGSVMGIVIGAANGAANDKYEVTVSNLKIEYRNV